MTALNNFDEALTAIRSNQLEHARRILSQIVRTNAVHVEAHTALGALLLDSGESDTAHEVLMRALSLAPSNARIRLLLGRLGMMRSKEGRHEDAISVLTRIVALHPQDAGALADLGMAELCSGKVSDSQRTFQRAAEISVGCAQAHVGLGMVHAHEKNWTEAVRELRVAVRLAPSSEAAHYDLGLACEANGDREQARLAFLRAAALSPDDGEIATALSRTLGTIPPSSHSDNNNSITGDVQLFPLTNLLEFLRMQTKSGTLTVTTPLGVGVLELQEGRLLSASSPRGKRLGQMLLEQKIITREQFNQAILEQTSAAAEMGATPFFGAIVLSHGWLTKEKLGDVVLDQIMTALNEILSWEQGTFSFQIHEGHLEQALLTFDLQYTILELFRRRDESRDRAAVEARRTPARNVR